MERKFSAKFGCMNREEKLCQDSHDSINSEDDSEDEEVENNIKELDFHSNFYAVRDAVDRFNELLSVSNDCLIPPDIPESFHRFADLVETEIVKYESNRDPSTHCIEIEFFEAVEKLSVMAAALARFQGESKYGVALDRASSVLQRAMMFLEDEFRSLLESDRVVGVSDPAPSGMNTPSKTTKQASFRSNLNFTTPVLPEPELTKQEDDGFCIHSPEIISRLSKIADQMITAAYDAECRQIYIVAQRNRFEESLSRIGFENISIDDMHKMPWESLEGEIAAWIRACKHCITVFFLDEKKLCEEVFVGRATVSDDILCNSVNGIVIKLLNFAEAVAMTKRSAEKLFKFLEMYECLGDLIASIEKILPGELSPEIKSEISSVRCRLGEAAIGMFSDLENSIKSDHGKTPVPCGAVHPLTRYVMNYLKYACDFKDIMEQIFNEHHNLSSGVNSPETDDNAEMQRTSHSSSFAPQLITIMELLDASLDSKSKLYKDLSLSYVFLMNNGRYIMQKIKASPEIQSMLGDTRKRSSVLRQYHKNYTRETWSKLLACLKDEGLMLGKGSINKPVLKERFKSFNTLFEEIHKTQSCWVVSDEQLQSELRVSITAVVVPAYRSFLGRFQQFLDTGRQTEKYVKFGPEELETFIDELFDGTPSSMARRRS